MRCGRRITTSFAFSTARAAPSMSSIIEAGLGRKKNDAGGDRYVERLFFSVHGNFDERIAAGAQPSGKPAHFRAEYEQCRPLQLKAAIINGASILLNADNVPTFFF